MPAIFHEPTGITYFECEAGSLRIASERDALDLVASCGEYETGLLLLNGECLDPAFFDLKSGLAGTVLLKLTTYQIRAAVILSRERIGSGKFSEFVLETNRGNQFRVFEQREDAVKWLTGEGR